MTNPVASLAALLQELLLYVAHRSDCPYDEGSSSPDSDFCTCRVESVVRRAREAARGVQYAPRERGSDAPHDTETLGDFWRGDVKLPADERDWVRTALDVLEAEAGPPREPPPDNWQLISELERSCRCIVGMAPCLHERAADALRAASSEALNELRRLDAGGRPEGPSAPPQKGTT